MDRTSGLCLAGALGRTSCLQAGGLRANQLTNKSVHMCRPTRPLTPNLFQHRPQWRVKKTTTRCGATTMSCASGSQPKCGALEEARKRTGERVGRGQSSAASALEECRAFAFRVEPLSCECLGRFFQDSQCEVSRFLLQTLLSVESSTREFLSFSAEDTPTFCRR